MTWKSSQERNYRLSKLEKKTRNRYGAGAYYNNKKKRIIRCSCHSSWLKHYCRKVTRRRIKANNDFFQKNCKYKRYHDYWWELL